MLALLSFSTSILEAALLTESGALDLLDWLVSEPQEGSSCLLLPNARITGVCPAPKFLHEFYSQLQNKHSAN